jgi:predicted transcriptional regulator
MRVELVKYFTVEDIVTEVRRLSLAYGSLDALAQKAAVAKCNTPMLQDELQLWRTIQGQHVEMRSSVIYDGTEKVANLTPMRMDLLESIKKLRPKSVRELAQSIKRDYKNVYEDMQALVDAGLVEIIVEGRKSRPVCVADEVRLTLEG